MDLFSITYPLHLYIDRVEMPLSLSSPGGFLQKISKMV